MRRRHDKNHQSYLDYCEWDKPTHPATAQGAGLSTNRPLEPSSNDQAKLTLGASRSAAVSTSKKSRFVKANMPATTLDGNIWVLLL